MLEHGRDSATARRSVSFAPVVGGCVDQRQFDPKLYQYGGLWIYPVGGLLKLCNAIGWITLTPDRTFYISQPEQFAPFYVVARAYSAGWGLVAVWAVFTIVRRLTGGTL